MCHLTPADFSASMKAPQKGREIVDNVVADTGGKGASMKALPKGREILVAPLVGALARTPQ